ncbi:MAG: hypothetical protein AAGM84_14300 [Pseudomonadota bacterium]
MILRHFALRDAEMAQLNELMYALNAPQAHKPVSDRLRAAFQTGLSNFLIAEGDSMDVFGKNPARFLRRTDLSSSDSRPVSYIYDFVTTHFKTYLETQFQVRQGSSDEEGQQRLLGLIQAMIDTRQQEMRGVPNPIAALISNTNVLNEGDGIPNSWLRNYIGYRRSSERGDIVRFVINLSSVGLRRTIQFKNEYLRNKEHWYVDGMGYAVQGTLYLIGHCTNRNDVSRGLRLMALRKHQREDLIYGQLVSMDRQDPICARILLVPATDHKIAADKSKFEDLVNEILVHDQDIDYSELLEVLRAQLPAELSHNESYLFKTICNANFSVLKCNPERDADIIDAELAFRNAFVDTWGHDLQEMRKAYVHMLHKAAAEFAEIKAPNKDVERRPWDTRAV